MSDIREINNKKKSETIKGELFTGVGKGAYFTSIESYREIYINVFGFVPYPGTLNLKIKNPEYISLLKEIRGLSGITIPPAEEGFCTARGFKVLVEKRIKGAIVIPDATFYSEDVLEILSPVNIRETLNIKDGDEVEVEVLV